MIMKKIFITIQLLLIGLSFIFAQDVSSVKKFNYGFSLSLITYPLNVFDKNLTLYGIHPNICYNINKHFFIESGIGLENCNYHYSENYLLNGNLESLEYNQKNIRIGVPISFGYQTKLFEKNINFITQLGVIYCFNMIYYDYVNSSYAPNMNSETYYHVSLKKALSSARFAPYCTLGLEKNIYKKLCLGISVYFLILHENQIVHYIWQSDWPSRYQTGIKLNLKFN